MKMICIYQKIICHKNYVIDDLRFIFSFIMPLGLCAIFYLFICNIYIVYIYASHTGVVESALKHPYLTNMAKYHPLFRLVDI